MGSDELTIGDVASAAGVRTSTIRYYESVGLIEPAPRMSGHRVYTRGVLDTLVFIRFAKSAGLSIPEIRRVLGEADEHTPLSARWQSVAHEKLRHVRVLIERAERMRGILETLLSCECVELAECPSRCGPPAPVPLRQARRVPDPHGS